MNKLSSAVDQPKGSVKVRRGLWMFLTMELMMILMFLTGAGVLDDLMDGLHMP